MPAHRSITNSNSVTLRPPLRWHDRRGGELVNQESARRARRHRSGYRSSHVMLRATERPEQARRRTPRHPQRSKTTILFIPRGWAPAHEVLRRSFHFATRTAPPLGDGGSRLRPPSVGAEKSTS